MKLRKQDGGHVVFFCPGCNEHHQVRVAGPGAWEFNGNFERPTFGPSILIRTGHFAPGWKPGEYCWCTHNAEAKAKGEPEAQFQCSICHFHVVNGEIQFGPDCTHPLKGMTVPVPDYTE
jgi:hypothetical protein